MNQVFVILSLVLIAASASDEFNCQFSAKYTKEDLEISQNRKEWTRQYFYWESQFVHNLGVDEKTGLTLNGQQIHIKTGMPEEGNERVTSFKAEAAHLALLVQTLNKEMHSELFYTQEDALEVLGEKLSTYEKYLASENNKGETIYIDSEIGSIKLSTEGLEQIFWTVLALNQVLEERYSELHSFLSRWTRFESSLRDVFYEMKFDLKNEIEYDKYWNYMTMPFLSNEDHKDALFQQEVKKFETFKNILSDSKKDTVMTERVLSSEEKESIEIAQIFDPKTVMGLFLVDKEGASVWLNYILSRFGGQSRFGTIAENECSAQGCLLNWETKIGPVISMMGGLSDIIQRRLRKDDLLNKYQKEKVFMKFYSHQHDIRQLVLPQGEPPQLRENFISCRVNTFPNDFIWGVATASYQIEGGWNADGKGLSIWDDFVRIPGRIDNDDTGDVADDFYHQYESDIQIMKDLGIPYFRLSFSWPRLLPEGTVDFVNWDGVAFYNDVIDKLIEAGITPFITLYHWDLPSALIKDKATDGWLSPMIQDQFAEYADFCFSMFGDRVKYWITFNEPKSFIWKGYGNGKNAPGRCSDYISEDCSWVADGGDTPTEPYLAAHNVILAHAKAVKVYRELYQEAQGGVIGMAGNSDFGEPFDPSCQEDIEAIDTMVQFQYGWYHDPLCFGKYPEAMENLISDNRLPSFTEEESELVKGSYDFLGLNHYSSKFVQHTGIVGTDYSNDGRYVENAYNINGEIIGPQGDSDWLNVYPQGLRKLLNWIDKRYDHKPIYIFENGVSVPGESEVSIEEAVKDQFRIDFYKSYIQNLEWAIQDGVDVRAYFTWSFMDNFEWNYGYSVRFGLVYIDFEDNQKRYVKDSAYWYSDWIKAQASQ